MSCNGSEPISNQVYTGITYFLIENFWDSIIHAPFIETIQHYQSQVNSRPLPARTCLLVLLATALGGVWTVEQPSGSLLEFYPAWREVMCSIFRCGGDHAAMYLEQWCNASIFVYPIENNRLMKDTDSPLSNQIGVELDWIQYILFSWALGFK